jgi:hypothetical protein
MAGRLNASRTIASAGREADQESLASFESGPVSAKPPIRYAWSGNGQVMNYRLLLRLQHAYFRLQLCKGTASAADTAA